MDQLDLKMLDLKIGVDNSQLKEWDIIVNDTLKKAKLNRPEDGFMMTGSKNGIHTELLGKILSEMQYMQVMMRSGKIEKIWNILGSVPDPEIPVISVVELGVIRNVEYIENEYIISVTPTYSGCPAVKTFQDDIRYNLKKIILITLK